MRLRNRSAAVNSEADKKVTVTEDEPDEPTTTEKLSDNENENCEKQDVDNKDEPAEEVKQVEEVEKVEQVEEVEQVDPEVDEDSDTGSDVFMPVGISMRTSETSDIEEERDGENEDEDEDKFQIEEDALQVDEDAENTVSLNLVENSKELSTSKACDPPSSPSEEEETHTNITDENTKTDLSKDAFTEGNIFSNPEIFFENHTMASKSKENTDEEDLKNEDQGDVKNTEQEEEGEHNISDDFMIGHQSGSDEEGPADIQPPNFDITETNIYLIDKKRSRSGKDIRRMVCECPFEPDDPLFIGCDEDCLNRLLMIECNKHCPTGEFCTNRSFQKGCIYDLEIIKAGKKGWGLKTNETISKGSFVIEYCGEVVDYNAFHTRTQYYHQEGISHYYFMTLKTNEIIDATKKGSISRFINHSCDPNCVTQKWTVNGFLRVGFFALRHIKPEEELSFDYQFQRYGEKPQECYCGASTCRGVIGTEQIASVPSYIEKFISNTSAKKKTKGGKESKKPLKEFYDSALAEDLNQLLGEKWILTEPKQTLELVRLMVKTETSHERRELLKIMQASADTSALKSFVRYKGLDLLWSWMIDASSENRNKYKYEILKTLKHIPIRNKNELDDSKLVGIVSKWAVPTVDSTSETHSEDETQSPSSDTDVRNDGASTSQDESAKEDEGESDKRKSAESMEEGEILEDDEQSNKKLKRKNKTKKKSELKRKEKESSRKRDVATLSQQLLEEWKLLKEVFRIPKKTRMPDQRPGESDGSPLADEKRGKDKTVDTLPSDALSSTTTTTTATTTTTTTTTKQIQPDSTYSSPISKQKQIRMHKGLGSFMTRVNEDNDLTSSSEEQSSSTFDENSDNSYMRHRKILKREWSEPMLKNNNRACSDQSDYSEQSGTVDSTSNWSGDSSYESFHNQRRCNDDRRTRRGKGRRRSYEDDRRKWNEYSHEEENEEKNRSWDERNCKNIRNRNWDGNRGGRQNREMGNHGNYEGPDESQLSWRNRNNDFWSPQPPPPKPQPPLPQPPQPPQFGELHSSQHLQSNIPSLMDQEFDQGCSMMPNQQLQRPLYPPNPNSTNINQQCPPSIMPPQMPNMMVPNCPPPYMLPPPPMPPQPLNPALNPHMNPLLPNQVQNNSPLVSPMSNQPYIPVSVPIPTDINQTFTPNPANFHGPTPPDNNIVNSVNQLHQLLTVDRHHTPEFNRSSTNTSPVQSTSSSPSRSKPLPALPPHWKTATDADGRVYYYHGVTRETSWDPPTQPEDTDVQLSSPQSKHSKKNSSEGLPSSPSSNHSPRIAAADTTHHHGPRTPPVPQSSSKTISSVELQKIRDTFKSKMSSVVVNCLNSYQKVDCKQGRIKNIDDFKFLARKLTHGLIMKEIQRIKNEEHLICNDSVKVKVKEYIRNYMKKFGVCYVRS